MAVTKANEAVEAKVRMTPLQIQRISQSVMIACEELGRRERPCVGVLASRQREPPDMEVKLPPYGSMNRVGPPSNLQVSQVRPQTSSNTEKPSPLCPTPIPDTQHLWLFLYFKVAGSTTVVSGIIHHCNYSSFLCLHEC